MPDPTTIAVLANHRHPRLRYVLREVAAHLGQRWVLFTDREKWRKSSAAGRIRYGGELSADLALYVPASPFLAGGAPTTEELAVSWAGEITQFFVQPGLRTRLAFDPLACIFFALSRYEEYGELETDQHDRFAGSNSHAYRHNYLELPVVRIWCAELAKELGLLFPDLAPPTYPAFQFQPTYDIDVLYAYHFRGYRGVASGLRDVVAGQFNRAWWRWSLSLADDPYNIITSLITLHLRPRPIPHLKPQIFWLVSDRATRQDVNPFPTPAPQQELMKQLKGQVQHGLHPSYNTYQSVELIRVEKDRLSTLLNETVTHSRQHFLRFRLPQTYRHLLAANIRNDHSMGYHDQIGWRSGTNLAHHWYDLDREEATYLKVHPFAAMEVTLARYLNLSPTEADSRILKLARATRCYGGPFALLWHNSSFAPEFGWEGWGAMYERLVEKITE